ncbi:putative c2h2 type zinc finger domain protein [Phaeomoniella chlamydospora]|uniref:Putative c2h2 type zinc finger domain protein n=1 Tax=Phaeomoniella chlamydospora TaxID=158046 RepID=A0A0G2GYB2_PHACM|nr:putative c2h2 type zinc finger domain protein [Phaeomoniella chlamydospora]
MDSLDWNSKTFNPEACRSSMLQAAAAQGEGTSLVAERSGSNEEDAFKDEVSLALPPMLPTKARRKPQTQVLRENLDYTSRDRILNLVIKNVQRENVEKIVRSFPATELYDDFMQHFFNESTRRTDDWIHAGTFRPNQCPAELLTPIIATGAVYQDQHVLRTIGYAMLEQVRRAIPKTVDLHHTMVKDLDIQQGYLLQLETRQYCANARKVEMAEAAFQQAVTMLRRNRQFRRCEYGTIFPTPLEDPETLEDMWKKWAKQEQKKRTVFHLLLHDVRAAFTFNTTPLIHFSELTLPLPESDYLWRANSAQEWAALYSRRSCLPPSRLPSLVDALQDITILSTNAEFLDLNYSMSIVIHGSASLIFQHRQIRTLQSQPNWHNPAVDSVAYTKCSSILNTILMAMKQLPPLRPEVMMMHAYHSSQLYISIEELHFVAGKADREDAVRAYESAKQWVDSPSSRYAAWYAAQVIRHARMAETRTIKDFLAVSLYHTALLLWTYGVLSRARTLAQTPRPPLNFIVMLDNDGSDSSQISEVQAFLHEGRGSPSIRHSKVGIAPLEDPTIVMDEIQTCIGVNWSSGPPELVKGTRRMISDLGAAAKMPTESRKSF